MDKKIYQLLPTMSFGDAVSNEALTMCDTIKKMGIETEIFAQNIDSRIANKVKPISAFQYNSIEDIIIYHMSTGSEISDFVMELPNKNKIIIYHNITPEHFFVKYNNVSYSLCKTGREQLKLMNKTFNLSLADSEYNRNELEALGYKNTVVLPIIINFNDYNQHPDQSIISKYDDDFVNLLFVGRIVPNKKQEDIIKSFYLYKKYINPKSRLFLIGSFKGMEKYEIYLRKLIDSLKLTDVIMPGQTSFKEILAYYSIASVFLCMSEHEGFCVPLLESMYFKVPIIAYNSTAIPDTLNNSGIIIKEKRYEMVAELINIIVTDEDIRESIINRQLDRLEFFNPENSIQLFKNCLNNYTLNQKG